MAKGRQVKSVSHTKSQPVEVEEKLTLSDFGEVFNVTFNVYKRKTDLRVKVIDLFLAFVVVIGIINGVYGVCFSRTPIKPFVSSLISCVSTFVMGVVLRIQLNSGDPANNEKVLKNVIVAQLVAQLAAINYLG